MRLATEIEPGTERLLKKSSVKYLTDDRFGKEKLLSNVRTTLQ
jgi:hypothetical protein